MRRSWAVVAAVFLVAVFVVAGCGGSKPRTYDAGRSLTSLAAGGWKAARAPGRSDTVAHVRQVDYLETVAPDGQRLDLQFLEAPDQATRELEATRAKTRGFKGTTVGNVLVIPAVDPTRAVPSLDLASLRSLLRS